MTTVLIAIATEVENAYIEDVGDRGYVAIQADVDKICLKFFIRDRHTLEYYKVAEANFLDQRRGGGGLKIMLRCSKWNWWFIYPLHDLNKAISCLQEVCRDEDALSKV